MILILVFAHKRVGVFSSGKVLSGTYPCSCVEYWDPHHRLDTPAVCGCQKTVSPCCVEGERDHKKHQAEMLLVTAREGDTKVLQGMKTIRKGG